MPRQILHPLAAKQFHHLLQLGFYVPALLLYGESLRSVSLYYPVRCDTLRSLRETPRNKNNPEFCSGTPSFTEKFYASKFRCFLFFMPNSNPLFPSKIRSYCNPGIDHHHR